jgi:hypothetical protein
MAASRSNSYLILAAAVGLALLLLAGLLVPSRSSFWPRTPEGWFGAATGPAALLDEPDRRQAR